MSNTAVFCVVADQSEVVVAGISSNMTILWYTADNAHTKYNSKRFFFAPPASFGCNLQCNGNATALTT